MGPTNFDRTVSLMPKISIEHASIIPRVKALRDLLDCSLFEATTLYEGWQHCTQFFKGMCASDSGRAQYIEGYYLARQLGRLKGTPGGQGFLEGIR